VIDLASLNPYKRYPRRYNSGRFLKLSTRFERRYKSPTEAMAARFVFSTIFGAPSVRSSLKAISGQGVFPIVIATAITITGHSYMAIRSVALLACALWVALDMGIYLSEKKWALCSKAITFSAAWSLLFCGAMGIMYWFTASTLEDQRSDVFAKLTAAAYFSPGGDPFFSSFTVTNGGSTDIGKHVMGCQMNLVVSSDGSAATGPGFVSIVGNTSHIRNTLEQLPEIETPILSGGDAQTDTCLSPVGLGGSVECMDVNVHLLYFLATQPNTKQVKVFRFVAERGLRAGDQLVWHNQPVLSKQSYCLPFYRAHHANGAS
jgi:hypothetical protein